MEIPFTLDLSELSYEDLSTIRHACIENMKKKIEDDFINGKVPGLDSQEWLLITQGEKVLAFNCYKNRNNVDLFYAKTAVDLWSIHNTLWNDKQKLPENNVVDFPKK